MKATYSSQMEGRQTGTKRTKWASTEAGLRGWPRLFQVGHEPDVQRREDDNETEELMEQPEGTQEHGI